MPINEIYKKEFEEAMDNVNKASEDLKNNLSKITLSANANDFENYLISLNNLNNVNEIFKDAVFKYHGFRPNITGFE